MAVFYFIDGKTAGSICQQAFAMRADDEVAARAKLVANGFPVLVDEDRYRPYSPWHYGYRPAP